MGTTLVIVELLIIGLQVLVWLGVLLWKPLGQYVHLDQLKDWAPLLTIGSVALAYTLGLVFDRFLGLFTSILQPWLSKRIAKLNEEKKDKHDRKRWYIKMLKWILGDETQNTQYQQHMLVHHFEAFKHLDEINHKKRLLRATSTNAVLLALMICLRAGLRGWLVVPLLLVAVAALPSWWRLDKGLLRTFEKLRKADTCDKKAKFPGEVK